MGTHVHTDTDQKQLTLRSDSSVTCKPTKHPGLGPSRSVHTKINMAEKPEYGQMELGLS